MAWEEQKSTARDKVECRRFLFFSCYGVQWRLLRSITVHTHAKTKSIRNPKLLLNSIFYKIMDSKSNQRLILDFRCAFKSILFLYVKFCKQGGVQNV